MLLGAAPLWAQRHHGGSSFVLSYPMAFPMGDLKDYISKTSFRGVSMEFNKWQKSNLEVGLESGWNVFYERVSEKVYSDKTASISGVQYRYTNSVPIIVGAKYYLDTDNETFKPYAGAGLGTTYTNRATDFGLYRITTNTWQFSVRPELGVRIKGPSGMDLLVGGKYYANFNNDELDGQSFLSLNVGFVFHSGY